MEYIDGFRIEEPHEANTTVPTQAISKNTRRVKFKWYLRSLACMVAVVRMVVDERDEEECVVGEGGEVPE